jgi:hypothetical protein
MTNQDEKGSGIGFWVPQLFYDIIARLIPGAITIGAIAFTYVGPATGLQSIRDWLNKPSDSYPSITILVGVIFGKSYTFTIVIRGIASVLNWARLAFWSLILRLRIIRRIFRESKKSEKKVTSDKNKEFSMKYDFIKRNDPSAGSRITKLHAEISMTEVLLLGFVISFVINLWKWVLHYRLPLRIKNSGYNVCAIHVQCYILATVHRGSPPGNRFGSFNPKLSPKGRPFHIAWKVRSSAFRRKFVAPFMLNYELPPEGRTTNIAFSHGFCVDGIRL